MKFKDLAYKVMVDAIYVPVYKLFYESKYQTLSISSIEATIDAIVNQKISLSRFGDGEFKWIDMTDQGSYEIDSPELKDRLVEVLKSDNDKVGIALPQAFRDPKILTAKIYWEREMGFYGKTWLANLKPGKHYYNTSVTRPYMDLKDKTVAKVIFSKFKAYMKNKTVLVIEGDNTHFGEGNDLLHDCANVVRLEGPAKNAFESYEKIKNDAEKLIKTNHPDVVLIALGPTATILAYDLTIETNVQSIDIGHFDIEYSWYLDGATKRTAVAGKDVNEVGD